MIHGKRIYNRQGWNASYPDVNVDYLSLFWFKLRAAKGPDSLQAYVSEDMDRFSYFIHM